MMENITISFMEPAEGFHGIVPCVALSYVCKTREKFFDIKTKIPIDLILEVKKG